MSMPDNRLSIQAFEWGAFSDLMGNQSMESTPQDDVMGRPSSVMSTLFTEDAGADRLWSDNGTVNMPKRSTYCRSRCCRISPRREAGRSVQSGIITGIEDLSSSFRGARKREPGISCCDIWIPGSLASLSPGMTTLFGIPGLVPGISVFRVGVARHGWPGRSPAMTADQVAHGYDHITRTFRRPHRRRWPVRHRRGLSPAAEMS